MEDFTEDVLETMVEPEFGTVINCEKLNIREAPRITSKAVAVVPAGAQLLINPCKNVDDWLNVYTESGIEGYCMEPYVSIK